MSRLSIRTLFWASFVFARHQTVIDPVQEETISGCANEDTSGEAFSPVQNAEDGWDHTICKGTSCKPINQKGPFFFLPIVVGQIEKNIYIYMKEFIDIS